MKVEICPRCRSTLHDAFEDRAIPLDETQQLPIASTLSLGEFSGLGKLGQTQQTIFLDLPLLGEHELGKKIPAIDLPLNLWQLFPRRGCPLQQVIDIGPCCTIYLSHSPLPQVFSGQDEGRVARPRRCATSALSGSTASAT